MTDDDYGEATLTQHHDGSVTVERADNVIAVDPVLIENLAARPHLDDDGTLVLDTAGQYRYERIGEAFNRGRRMIIYRRLQRQEEHG